MFSWKENGKNNVRESIELNGFFEVVHIVFNLNSRPDECNFSESR